MLSNSFDRLAPAGVLLLLAVLSGAIPSSAQILLDDEFDDGFVAPIYNDLCLTGATETAGAYFFPGPNLGCFAFFGFFPASITEVLEPGLVVPDNRILFELRIDRIPMILPEQASGELAGFGLNPEANPGLGLNLLLQRFPTGLSVLLFDPETAQAVQSAVVSTNPDSDPLLSAADTIELRLELGPNLGNTLFPRGSYRLCTNATCLTDTSPPFILLADVPGSTGNDALALADAARLTIQGIALVGQANAFAAERLEVVPEPDDQVVLISAVLVLAFLGSTKRHRA